MAHPPHRGFTMILILWLQGTWCAKGPKGCSLGKPEQERVASSSILVGASVPPPPRRPQRKTPWVAPACADCPGFCGCPGFHVGLGASDCSPGLAFCFTGPWTLLGSAARTSPTTRAKTGRTAHVFAAQGGTRRTPPHGHSVPPLNLLLPPLNLLLPPLNLSSSSSSNKAPLLLAKGPPPASDASPLPPSRELKN